MSIRAGLTASSSRISHRHTITSLPRSPIIHSVRYNGSLSTMQDVQRRLDEIERQKADAAAQRRRDEGRMRVQGMTAPKIAKLDDIGLQVYQPLAKAWFHWSWLFKPSPDRDAGPQVRGKAIFAHVQEAATSANAVRKALEKESSVIVAVSPERRSLWEWLNYQLNFGRGQLTRLLSPTLDRALDVYCAYNRALAEGNVAGINATSIGKMRSNGVKIAKANIGGNWELVNRESIKPKILWYVVGDADPTAKVAAGQLCVEIESTQTLTTFANKKPTTRTTKVVDRIVFVHLEPDVGSEGLKMYERVPVYLPPFLVDAAGKQEQADVVQKAMADLRRRQKK